MKKIDLHIHTIPTISDSHFIFSLDAFQRYVSEAKLDAVAVTNHDMFDGDQFKIIQNALDVTVFPGIEVNVEKGHLLVISSSTRLNDFKVRTELVSKKITKTGDSLSIDELIQIFGDLNNYLLIPHYDKTPSITGEALERLMPFVSAGEVDSAKKFIRSVRDESKLTPVLFSDARIKKDLAKAPTRQTFIDCGTLTLEALKSCFRDKSKVALSEKDGNNLWPVFEDGQRLSTGLNILLGERSSGKTHTLDRIDSIAGNTKYIRQFSLVQKDEASYEQEFNSDVQKKRSCYTDNYLSGLKIILDDIMTVDLEANDREVEQYIASLVKSAEEANRRDAFSKTALFDEIEFPTSEPTTLSKLIQSVRQVIENLQYRDIIEKHLRMQSLKQLACELIQLLWDKEFENKKKNFVNETIQNVRQQLRMRSSAVPVKHVDLYKTSMDRKRVERFKEIVSFLKSEHILSIESIQGFCIEAKKVPFTGAAEIRTASRTKGSFSEAYKDYGDPYKYLCALKCIEVLPRSEIYKLFVNIRYRILNSDGFEVSGGERSEFRLLQEIADAQNFDILLIDEPESSFDNMFLKSDVNQILKEISKTMPVVVVTHNSTVGASIDADYLLYASKDIEKGKPIYRLYSGYPTDKELVSIDGKVISNHRIMLNSLEAGSETYDSRRKGYEAIKN